jgi:hypothetical protein
VSVEGGRPAALTAGVESGISVATDERFPRIPIQTPSAAHHSIPSARTCASLGPVARWRKSTCTRCVGPVHVAIIPRAGRRTAHSWASRWGSPKAWGWGSDWGSDWGSEGWILSQRTPASWKTDPARHARPLRGRCSCRCLDLANRRRSGGSGAGRWAGRRARRGSAGEPRHRYSLSTKG